jgi:hypothetical protein
MYEKKKEKGEKRKKSKVEWSHIHQMRE